MKSNLVLNQTNFKIFVKMIKIKKIRNPKNQSHDQTGGFHKKTTKLEPQLKVPFEIKN